LHLLSKSFIYKVVLVGLCI